MEIADLIVINKADGDLKSAAARTRADYAGALRLLRKRPQDPEGFPRATAVSALEEDGLEETWAALQELTDWRRAQGFWDRTRAAQARYWFEQDVKHRLLAQLETPQAKDDLARLSDAVAEGARDPAEAAAEFVSRLRAD